MDIKKEKQVFFNNIIKLRKQQEISLEALSQRSGVPLEMLEELERGSIPEEMTVDDAAALADVFQCKIWELFE